MEKEIWKTVLENMEHAKKNNLFIARVKSEDVPKIRKLANEGNLSQREIGIMFNISRSNVQAIKSGITWRNH